MNLTLIDWAIVVICLSVLFFGVRLSKSFVKSVVDFLSAGRTAGRYMITVSQGMAAIGAITIVGQWEMNYVAGFALRWWEFTMAVVLLIMTVSGWVIYRFRQTRALTIAQFLEVRYSRNFRIFAGIMAFVSGLLNFGIFPAVSARFIIYFCGFPLYFKLLGITVSTFPVVMASFLIISLYFVFSGGQIAVIITEFIQGVFSNFTFLIIIVICLFVVNWDQVFQAVITAPKDQSLINPYKTSAVPDFNFWYFLINVIGVIYVKLSWQGSQGFNSSAKSAHEAKMGEVLGNLRDIPKWLFLVFIPIVAYTVLHHPHFAGIAGQVNQTLGGVGTKAIQSQLRIPLVLSKILPVGVMGAFLAVMVMATIGTHNSYMHSWGSIFIQDIIMPFRKKPFEPQQHLKVLRYSILGVCIFIFLFSLFFPMTDYIFLYFAITAAIFVGGSGAVIIGGLYWKKGTTAAAWSALIVGCVISVTGIILQQIYPNFPINGQYFWGISMGVSTLVYIIVSLLSGKEDFNMDKMLHRGQYAIKEESVVVDKVPVKGLKMLGMGKEFTKGDKIIYLAAYSWTFLWVIVFIIGTIMSFSGNVPDSSWMLFWKTFVMINLFVSLIVIVWFAIGGIKDFKDMLYRLKTMVRDHKDDGRVKTEADEAEKVQIKVDPSESVKG
ncbi:MAG: sodium:solute symporter [Bacteroidota bacterium]|nr:sodium:solute symporter [Bacteroidota bacterium]MDP4191757.1 sodium:solute symporter [Bacteroidota bacterium]MDP4195538.1 sodium:solute symporter [Bacteroidota bacterium]